MGAKSGPEEKYSVIVDLTDDWYFYNKKLDIYTPYIEGISPNNPALTAFIDAKKYQHFFLVAKSIYPESYLFINGQFFAELEEDKWYTIPIAKIGSKEQQIAVSLYGPTNPSSKELFIGALVDNSLESQGILRDNLLKMKTRTSLPNLNGIILLFCCFILFATILVNINPKAFNEYFNFSDILIYIIRETRYLVSKPLNQTNLAFLALLSFIMALFYLLMASKGIHLFQKQLLARGVQENFSFIILFLRAFVIAFVVYVSKYFLLSISGNLFGIGKTVNIHYFKIVQYSLFFLGILIFVFYAVILSIPYIDNFRQILTWASILFFGLRTLLIYITILKSADIQSYYLFAYLCVVEILPIFIGIKFAF